MYVDRFCGQVLRKYLRGTQGLSSASPLSIPTTVAVDNLGNIVWLCDLMPGTSADVMIWEQRGPSRTHGQFFDFEVGAHDGAY